MKLKKDFEVIFKGKKMVLRAGVDYKNLPKEITEQIPSPRAKKPAAKK